VARGTQKKSGVKSLVELVLTVAVAVGLALLIQAFIVKPFRIPSPSMVPTLAVGQRVLVNRLAYIFGSPQRGQIVVFNAPGKANGCGAGDAGTTFVKRLVGLPGETVREDDSGSIWIRRPGRSTWTKLAEPYLSSTTRRDDTAHFGRSWPVPKGDYFMLGDNRPNSCDSRSWGAVPRSNLIGPVIFTYWPPGRISYHAGGW